MNEIGNYSGSRPLFGDEPIVFDVNADGPWTIHIEAISAASGAAFSGTGDAVSGLITDTPDNGGWNISHDGQDNFIVYLHCADGSDLVQNEIGAVSGSTIVSFGDSPCLWEIEADGNWSLAPQ
ncbi:MAG: hypothetical protein WD472_02750 [Dehalococcoidia bacterium]